MLASERLPRCPAEGRLCGTSASFAVKVYSLDSHEPQLQDFRGDPAPRVSTRGIPKERHQPRRIFPRDRTPARNEAILQPDSWPTKGVFLINHRFFHFVRCESWLERIPCCRWRKEAPNNIPDGKGRSWYIRALPSVTSKPLS